MQPDIPKYGKGTVTPGGGVGGGEKDYISYTVSAPSGRGTALFSTDGIHYYHLCTI